MGLSSVKLQVLIIWTALIAVLGVVVFAVLKELDVWEGDFFGSIVNFGQSIANGVNGFFKALFGPNG